MTAFNIVRFRVKEGREQDFLNAHQRENPQWPGFAASSLIKTGDRSYCIIGEWSDMNAMGNSMSDMIGFLDTFRDTLEDLGGDLGVSDPVSGPVVVKMV